MVHGGPGADHSIAKPCLTQLTDIAQAYWSHATTEGREVSKGKILR